MAIVYDGTIKRILERLDDLDGEVFGPGASAYQIGRRLNGETGTIGAARVTATGATASRSASDRAADVACVLDWIPAQDHAAIKNRTTTNAYTTEIQAAITQVGKGKIVFPLGLYNHEGLTIADSITLEGQGWSYTAATLQNVHATNHGISIINNDMIGAWLCNLNVKGYSNVNPAVTGSCVYIKSQGQTVLDRVYGTHGCHGLTVDGLSSVITVRDCRFQANVNDGIFGRGGPAYANQINAIRILDTQCTHNGRHGVNLWPTQGLTIRDCTIQSNANVGINFDAHDMAILSADARDVLITGCWLEANAYGAIKAVTRYNAGTGERHYLLNLRIYDNVISLYSPATSGLSLISLTCDNPAIGSSYQGCYIGRNQYEGTGSLNNWIDFGNAHDYTSILDLQHVEAGIPIAVFANRGGLTVRGMDTWTRVSSDIGDASITVTPRASSRIVRYATTLTANRSVTLSTTNVTHGDTFRIVRTGLGAFTLAVQREDATILKTMPSATAAWCDVAYDGTAWQLTGYGTL